MTSVKRTAQDQGADDAVPRKRKPLDAFFNVRPAKKPEPFGVSTQVQIASISPLPAPACEQR